MNRAVFLFFTIGCYASAAPIWAAGGSAAGDALAYGDPSEQIRVALQYEHGEGLRKDPRKALELYCLAARQGYAEAQFKMGWMYANGRGVPRDDLAAGALFTLAAAQGDIGAKKALNFVRSQDSEHLPSCMLPEIPEPVAEAAAVPQPTPDKEIAAAGEVDAEASYPGPEGPVRNLVLTMAPGFGVDPRLALAIISAESAFNPMAVSPKNAQGLMQLIPETATRFGVKKILDPAENIRGGLSYLRWLLAFFQGNVSLVVAAYNAGERAVERYRGIPPYLETRSYVKRVTELYTRAVHPFQADVVAPSPLVILPEPGAKTVLAGAKAVTAAAKTR